MMAARKKNMFGSQKRRSGGRFFFALILLLIIASGSYAYIQGYQPLSWITRKQTPKTIEKSTQVSPTGEALPTPAPTPTPFKAVIEEPPIPMDNQTSQHLKDFRNQAEALAEQFPKTFILRGSPDIKQVAITIDDGPDTIYTPQILTILKKNNAKATFFLKGDLVLKNPRTTKKILADGHEIGNHAWTHPRFEQLSLTQVKKEISKTEDAINKTIKKRPALIRPPYGMMTADQISYFKKKGYSIIDWSIDAMDWYTQDDQLIFDAATKVLHNGAIILMHSAEGKDGRGGTVKALDRLLPYLHEQGYTLVTVSELLKSIK